MDKHTKHIVCYSGGHSSALVAIEVVRKYGKDNVILLNHDIHPNSEEDDIKRFKNEISQYLEIPITFANHDDWENKDQFDVVVDAKAFKVRNGQALCTYFLKTKPFEKYLKKHFSDKNCIIYYGFDANEKQRIQRRSSILGQQGYRTDYPLAFWKRTIQSVTEIDIQPPNSYNNFKHANCIGCLKAGKQHWYIVYCTRPDIWQKAKDAEDEIGYSIIRGTYLDELEDLFKRMKKASVPITEHIHPATFWSKAKKQIKYDNLLVFNEEDQKPCECVF